MNNYSVLIPTRDSARWIIPFYECYKRNGIEPFYVVDTRCVDDTFDKLKKAKAKVIQYCPSGDFPEAGMLEAGCSFVDARWVLRIDDDEFPSRALFDWTDNIARKSANQQWLISRREVFLRGDQYVYSRSIGRYANPYSPYYLNPHPRLFHKDRVQFVREVHTSGLADPVFFDFAPQAAFYAHFNCLIRSPQERLNKIRRYESIKALSTWRAADEYLPEIFDNKIHFPLDHGLSEFEFIISHCKALSSRTDIDITEIELELTRTSVAKHHEHNRNLRKSIPKKHHTLDDMAWIENVPQIMKKPLSEVLCSFGSSRLKEIGEVMWDHAQLYNSLKR